MFVRFAQEGQMTPPDLPAAEIATYLESDGHASYEEGRFGA